tara:strand:- start:1871 stop:1975 length:105 start_codon:yes stop_codon:yes gene_type:complete
LEFKTDPNDSKYAQALRMEFLINFADIPLKGLYG